MVTDSNGKSNEKRIVTITPTIERELPETGRYWFPARVLNAGVDHTRKAHA